MNKILVIGGGASGIMAALKAAEDKDNKVILLERQARVGRKLLATGNGRCNLTNIAAKAENYHGEQAEFAIPALSAFPPEKTLDFFHSLGLLTVTEQSGRVYPLSDSANSVLDVLRFALDKSGVELRSGCIAKEIRRSSIGGYAVITDGGRIDCDKLIVACGGCAGSKLGGVMDGYELLKPLGHKRTKLMPSLVQLICEGDFPRSLKGVRADCEIKLTCGGDCLAKSAGEIQFTENGVSGPVSFEISRAASEAGEGAVHIDFLRFYDLAQVEELLNHRQAAYPELEAAELLTGMVHNRLGRMLVKYASIQANTPLKNLSPGEISALAALCKDFTLELKGTEGFDKAQVTAGGIKTTGFNPETLESWFMPGLFCCGELLDIDGDCGGYNLQWAWASGHLAGRLGK